MLHLPQADHATSCTVCLLLARESGSHFHTADTTIITVDATCAGELSAPWEFAEPPSPETPPLPPLPSRRAFHLPTASMWLWKPRPCSENRQAPQRTSSPADAGLWPACLGY